MVFPRESHPRLSVDTLGISIDLHAFLRHLCIPQKIQRHPYEVTLDLVQFLANFFSRHEGIVKMTLLELVVLRQEGFVIVEGFDYR